MNHLLFPVDVFIPEMADFTDPQAGRIHGRGNGLMLIIVYRFNELVYLFPGKNDRELSITFHFRHLTTISCAKWQNFSTCTVAIRSHIFMQFIAMKMRLRISNRTGRIFVLRYSGLSGLGYIF